MPSGKKKMDISSRAPNTFGETKMLEEIVKEKFGVEHFGVMVSEKIVLTTAKCPKCGSYDTLFDY